MLTGNRPPRRRTPTLKAREETRNSRSNCVNKQNLRRKVSCNPDGDGPDNSSAQSESVDEYGDLPAPCRSSSGSQEANGLCRNQQEEATTMLQTIIGSAMALPNNKPSGENPHGEDANRTICSNEQGKDELINRLKIEIEDLKTERKRMTDHIEVLQALRKEHEQKITQLKSIAIIAGKPPNRKRRKRNSRQNGEVNISELCIFNEIVYKRVNDIETETFVKAIMNENYSLEVVNVLRKMYSRMSRLAYFTLNEINIQAFINGSDVVFGTVSTVQESMCNNVYDWNSCCYTMSSEQERNLGISDLVVHTVENISGDQSYVMNCPMQRIKNNDFFSESREYTERYLLQHGYIFMRLEEGDNLKIQRSEFKEILEDCDELKERLILCCRYTLGNKKRLVKQMYLYGLGYFNDNGKNLCSLCIRTRNSGNSNSPNTNYERGECSECHRNCQRLVKRSSSGTLVTNWWRKAIHSQIGMEGSEEKELLLTRNVEGDRVNKLFQNNASQDAFRKFFEYESLKCIDHYTYTSVVNIARMDTWMSVMLLHLQKDSFKIRKGGLYVQRLINDFTTLKSNAYQQLQKEILEELRNFFLKAIMQKYLRMNYM